MRLTGTEPSGLWLGIDDKDIVEIVGQVVAGAQVIDGLADVPKHRHSDNVAAHQTPGAVLREGEPLLNSAARCERHRGQDLFLEVLVEIFENIDGIVGLKLLDHVGDVVGTQEFDDVFQDRLVQMGQNLWVELPGEAHRAPGGAGAT